MSSRSAPPAKVARHARPHAAGRPARDGDQGTSERAMLVAREVERKLSEGCSDILTVEALQAWMAAACKLYAAQIESGQQMLPVQEQQRCHRHRRHDHGKRAAARGQPRRVRARHVAELERSIDPVEQTQPARNAHQERADGTHRRTRTANFGRGVEYDQAPGARATAGGAAEIRRNADRRLRRAPLRERELRRDPSVHGERRSATADDRRPRLRSARHRTVAGRLHPGHGRTRHALPDAAVGEDRFRPDARHPARRALDGCHGRRLFVPVPDRDAQYRSASAEGDGERAVLGLQSLAHGEGAARGARPHVLHAVPAVLRSGPVPAPRGNLRPPQGRRRLHGDDGAQSSGQRQRLYEGLSRHGRARAEPRVPFRPELARAGIPRLQPVHLGPRARLLLLQHRPLHQLGHQRACASAFPSCR